MRDLRMRHLHQDSGGKARIQIGALHAGPVGRERASRAAGLRIVVAQCLHLRRQGLFQALRARGEDVEDLGLAGFARAAAAGVGGRRAFAGVFAFLGKFRLLREFRLLGVFGRLRVFGLGRELRRGAVVLEGVVEASGRRGGGDVLIVAQSRRALLRTRGTRSGRRVAAGFVSAAPGRLAAA
ncbi:hypothetical protein D3C87_1456770 [compost metagenome]